MLRGATLGCVSVTLVHTLTSPQEEELWRLYQEEWWTRDRSLEDVRRMLAGSDLVFGMIADPGGTLAGFARVLSDRVFKAVVLDMIVAGPWRGEGLGRRLMGAVLAHPELAGVRHFELYCLEEVAPFYEQWGFTADMGSLCFMRRSGPS